jgi:hypothetical protein
VDLSVIAMWLVHEATQSTHQCLCTDLESKKQTVASLEQPRMGKSSRYPSDEIEPFLNDL